MKDLLKYFFEDRVFTVCWLFLVMFVAVNAFADDIDYAACKMEIRFERVSVPRDQILVYNSSVEARQKRGSILYAGIPTSEHRTCYLIARHIDNLILKIRPEDIEEEWK